MFNGWNIEDYVLSANSSRTPPLNYVIMAQRQEAPSKNKLYSIISYAVHNKL